MNRLIFYFSLLLTSLLIGCDKTNYDKGYANGFQAGESKGNLEGFGRGKKEGYSQGYTDGFAKSGKDLKVSDITINFLTTNSFVVFGKVVAWIFVLLNGIVVICCLFSDSRIGIILAKLLICVIAIGLAYVSMFIIDVNSVLFFKLDGVLKYITIALLFIFSMFLSSFIYKFFEYEATFFILGVLLIATFIGFYFSLFLTDIYTYVISNTFIIGAMFSVVLGVMIYTVYKLVDSTTKNLSSET